jgi:hypothetical protein
MLTTTAHPHLEEAAGHPAQEPSEFGKNTDGE